MCTSLFPRVWRPEQINLSASGRSDFFRGKRESQSTRDDIDRRSGMNRRSDCSGFTSRPGLISRFLPLFLFSLSLSIQPSRRDDDWCGKKRGRSSDRPCTLPSAWNNLAPEIARIAAEDSDSQERRVQEISIKSISTPRPMSNKF